MRLEKLLHWHQGFGAELQALMDFLVTVRAERCHVAKEVRPLSDGAMCLGGQAVVAANLAGVGLDPRSGGLAEPLFALLGLSIRRVMAEAEPLRLMGAHTAREGATLPGLTLSEHHPAFPTSLTTRGVRHLDAAVAAVGRFLNLFGKALRAPSPGAGGVDGQPLAATLAQTGRVLGKPAGAAALRPRVVADDRHAARLTRALRPFGCFVAVVADACRFSMTCQCDATTLARLRTRSAGTRHDRLQPGDAPVYHAAGIAA